MKNNSVNNQHAYVEQTIPITSDPLILVGLLAESDLSDTYLAYEDHGKWFFGIGVVAMITANMNTTCLEINGRSYQWQNEVLVDSVQSALASLPIQNWRAYGIANFELARHNYKLPSSIADDTLLQLFVPEYEICLQEGSAVIRALTDEILQDFVQMVRAIDRSVGTPIASSFDLRITDNRLKVPEIETEGAHSYQQSVASAVREINAHQYLKVILSRSIPLSQEIDVVATYIAGCRGNTPARSFLLSLDQMKAAGFSPETVVEVSPEGWVSTQPLAGTRSLGSSVEEEARLREELLHDSKEIHEHAVSVQLAFEELRGVCIKDSVQIVDFMSIARRNTVQHIASRIKGQLKKENNAWHAFQALFPAVTASGIPKRESIDAIGRLEPGPRNLYSGCVMITDSMGMLDAALVLRTVFQKNKTAWLHVGAGIVDMSNPMREAEETREKIRSVSQYLVHV